VPRIVGQHGLDDAVDVAAVLRSRIDRAALSWSKGCRLRPRLIAGLIPEPLGDMSQEDRQAIDERRALIETRARALAEECVAGGTAWVRRMGEPPVQPYSRERWIRAVSTVAAYRDRYEISGDRPAGGGRQATRSSLSVSAPSVQCARPRIWP
jgi:hypothetical protein